MSETQSVNAKTRWEKCKLASIKLGCGKTHVHDRLYSRMLKENILDLVCEGDEPSILVVQSWPEFNDERSSGWSPDNHVTKVENPIDRLKIADWFVKKVGGLEKAVKLLDYYAKLESIR